MERHQIPRRPTLPQNDRRPSQTLHRQDQVSFPYFLPISPIFLFPQTPTKSHPQGHGRRPTPRRRRRRFHHPNLPLQPPQRRREALSAQPHGRGAREICESREGVGGREGEVRRWAVGGGGLKGTSWGRPGVEGGPMGRSRLGIKQKEKEEWGWVCCNGCFNRESCVERGRTSLDTRIVCTYRVTEGIWKSTDLSTPTFITCASYYRAKSLATSTYRLHIHTSSASLFETFGFNSHDLCI